MCSWHIWNGWKFPNPRYHNQIAVVAQIAIQGSNNANWTSGMAFLLESLVSFGGSESGNISAFHEICRPPTSCCWMKHALTTSLSLNLTLLAILLILGQQSTKGTLIGVLAISTQLFLSVFQCQKPKETKPFTHPNLVPVQRFVSGTGTSSTASIKNSTNNLEKLVDVSFCTNGFTAILDWVY